MPLSYNLIDPFDYNIISPLVDDIIENKVTLEEATNLIVKKTKNFAKRQYTWFENRFDQNLKIYGEDNLSLVVETFKKII